MPPWYAIAGDDQPNRKQRRGRPVSAQRLRAAYNLSHPRDRRRMLPKLAAAVRSAYLRALLSGHRLEAVAWAQAWGELARRVAMHQGKPYAPIAMLSHAERARYRRQLAGQPAPRRARARRKRR